MLYISQIFNKPIINKGQTIGKVVEFVVSGNLQNPVISKIIIRQGGLEKVVPTAALKFANGHWALKSKDVKLLAREKRDFYLIEDLLDKQVIDTNGKRLVRVNDVIIAKNGELKVDGIDIGFSGILRRLNLSFLAINMRTITLPWALIEAFDYQTGNVQLKLTQNKLNAFHPAEIADILEEAGAKERVGLVNALDAEIAADALEETDEETQSAILEQVTPSRLKKIINKMRSSEIADIIHRINPFTGGQIFRTLEQEKADRVKKLLIFADDEAGGLMDVFTFREKVTATVAQTVGGLLERKSRPEIIIVVDEKEKLVGAVAVKNFINIDPQTKLSELVKNKYSVYQDASFSEILKLFSAYNLRVLPVVDKEEKVIGAITVDSILAKIEEEGEIEDAI